MTAPPIDTATPAGGAASELETAPRASVIALPTRRSGDRSDPVLLAVALLLALTMAASPLVSGFYDFAVWGPIALVAMVLLIVVAWGRRPVLSGRARLAAGGLCALLALSAASMLWAQSKESAWTDTNRLALYVTVFLLTVVAVRDRRSARLVVLVLGLAALLTSVGLAAEFLLGGGAGAFLTRRLNAPIGYINGTAGLLVMGIWPWLAFAERARGRWQRAASLAAATVIAATFVLTQSRAVIPATILTAVLVLACGPGRPRRAVHLIVLAGAVAVSVPWTLRVYSAGGLAARATNPPQHLLRDAALAIVLAGVLAGGAALALDALVRRFPAGRRERLSRQLGATLLAIGAVGLIGGVTLGHGWIAREYDTFTADRVNQAASVRFVDASGFRYDLWRVAVKEFTAHPLGGVGAGNYDTDYYRLRRNPEYVVQPHSLELQMAAELGIGGLLALLVFCGVVLVSGFARTGTLAARDPVIRIAALGVFSAWLIDTSVDWLYDIPGLTGMAMIAAALLVLPAPGSPGLTPARSAWPRRRRHQAALVAGLGIVALLAASLGRQYVATRYAASGQAEIARSPASAIGTLRTAERLDPFSLSTLYSLASAEARLDDYAQARADLLAAERREPSNYVPPALLGDLATRRGYLSVALREYRRAERLDPNDPGLEAPADQLQAKLRR